MLTRHWKMYSLLGIVMALVSSCTKEHDLYKPGNQKLTDLEIPADFDWSTTRSVECSIVSPVPANISIYLDENCSENQLVAILPVSKEATPLKLDVPKGNSTIYIQYPTKEGKKVITVNLDKSITRAGGTMIQLPEETIQDNNENEQMYGFYSPAKNEMGTIMFEDSWPQLGDYDFNDFVIYYNISALYKNGGGSHKEDYDNEGITITVQFRAIGGMLPYRLCLQLDKMPAKFISQNDIELIQTNDKVQMVFLNEGDDAPAIFTFNGTDKLREKPGAYYNTEIANKVNESDLVTISYRLKLNSFNNAAKSIALSESSSSYTHNFFLQNLTNNREIHLRGYAPTKRYTNYSVDAQANQGMQEGVTYCTANNFVWGIKIYGPSAHAREQIDILKAFPEFRNFIETSANPSWYKVADPDKVISY